MKAMKPVFFVFLLLVVVVGLQQSLFIVDQTQQALVIQLGHPLDKVYRPGLHFKIPFIQTSCTLKPAFWTMTPVLQKL